MVLPSALAVSRSVPVRPPQRAALASDRSDAGSRRRGRAAPPPRRTGRPDTPHFPVDLGPPGIRRQTSVVVDRRSAEDQPFRGQPGPFWECRLNGPIAKRAMRKRFLLALGHNLHIVWPGLSTILACPRVLRFLIAHL